MIRVVEPQDTSLLAPTSEDALDTHHLLSLRRGPSSPQRYLVRASPIGSSQRVKKLSPAVETAQRSFFVWRVGSERTALNYCNDHAICGRRP